MLENMRNHAQSWLAKIILGGVALSFVLWGIGDYFLGSRVQTVATVDGEPITDSAFYRAYERQLNTYRAVLGKRFSKKAMEQMGVKRMTLQTLINRHLMLDEADNMGLAAPKSALLARVRSNPAFQSAGNFDPQRYEILTRNMGFRTPSDYESSLRLDLMVDALQRSIMDSAQVSDAEVLARYRREYEKRELTALIVSPAGLEKSIRVGDADARAFYAAHKDRYLSHLRLKLAAVVIDPASLARDIEIGESDIKSAYEERKDQLVEPETRLARHILVRLDGNADEKTQKKARTKIEKALKLLKSGKAFTAVAGEMSEDAATAKHGGNLGYFRQGVMAPAFDKAVFGMKKGQISKIVRTPRGLHVIKLLDIRPARVQSLAEAHNRLRDELRRGKAEEEAYKLSQDLDDALGREDNLKAAAASLNMKVQEIGPLSLDEALADPLLGKDAAFRSQVFAMQPGAPVDVTELADGRFAAVEVLERKKPDVLPFARVVQRVYADAREEAAGKAARKQAEALLKDAVNAPIASLGQRHGLPIYLTKPVRSNGMGDSEASWLTPGVLQAAFATAGGKTVDRVIEVPQGFAIVQVKRIIKADKAKFTGRADAIRTELERSRGAARFARWMAGVRSRHEVRINPDVLARF